MFCLCRMCCAASFQKDLVGIQMDLVSIVCIQKFVKYLRKIEFGSDEYLQLDGQTISLIFTYKKLKMLIIKEQMARIFN